MAATDQPNPELRNDRSFPHLPLTGAGAPRRANQRITDAWPVRAPGVGGEPRLPLPQPEGR